MFFSIITKNSNWEILTKNLGTLKEKMGFMMKIFNIFGVHWKIQFLWEELTENQYRGRIA